MMLKKRNKKFANWYQNYYINLLNYLVNVSEIAILFTIRFKT